MSGSISNSAAPVRDSSVQSQSQTSGGRTVRGMTLGFALLGATLAAAGPAFARGGISTHGDATRWVAALEDRGDASFGEHSGFALPAQAEPLNRSPQDVCTAEQNFFIRGLDAKVSYLPIHNASEDGYAWVAKGEFCRTSQGTYHRLPSDVQTQSDKDQCGDQRRVLFQGSDGKFVPIEARVCTNVLGIQYLRRAPELPYDPNIPIIVRVPGYSAGDPEK